MTYDEKDLFSFEIAGHGASHRLLAESNEERATWVSGLQNVLLAVQIQNSAVPFDAMLCQVRESCSAQRASSSGSSSSSVTGARTSVGLVLDGTNVVSVVKGSPASGDFNGGKLEANDRVLSVDGKKVEKDNVLQLLRGSDDVGSQVILQIHKHGTLKTTFEAPLRRTEMARIREVATLYQLTDDLVKHPSKNLAQKVAEKVAAVERLDRSLINVGFERIDALEGHVCELLGTRNELDEQAGVAILQLQEMLDETVARLPPAQRNAASPRASLSPRVGSWVREKLAALYDSSRVPDESDIEELRQEVERHEAEMAEALKANKTLKRTIDGLEQKLQEAEAKVANLTTLTSKDNWMATHNAQSADELRAQNDKLDRDLATANAKIEELNKIGERLLAQGSPRKEQSAKALEEMSRKLVALEEQLHATKKMVKEGTAREDELVAKNRAALSVQATLEAQIQNLTRQLKQSTQTLQSKEEELDNLRIVMEKKGRAKEVLAPGYHSQRSQPASRSVAETHVETQKLEREIAVLKSQQEALDHKLQIALVEKETLARELVDVQDELSEICCKWEQEKSLRESEEMTFRDRLRKEEKLIKDKTATISQLHDDMSSLQRDLDRQRDVVEETQDCAARDLSQVVAQLNERHREQLEDLVGEREDLKARMCAADGEKEALHDKISHLEKRLEELNDEHERGISGAEQRMHAKFHVERGKLEEQLRRMEHKCNDQVHQMEQLVASARLEATGEIALEKRMHAETNKELRDAQHTCKAVQESMAHISQEKAAMEREIERLKSKVDIAGSQMSDAEQQLIEEQQRYRDQIEKMENENTKMRSTERRLDAEKAEVLNRLSEAERTIKEGVAAQSRQREESDRLEGESTQLRSDLRRLEMELGEMQYRMAEADSSLKETMQLVDAPTPVAVPRMVAALLKEASTKDEYDNLRARVKDAETILEALAEILKTEDFESLPRFAAHMSKQRHSLKDAQVQLEEELRLLRAELEGSRRQSKSDINSVADDLSRHRAALARAEAERDQLQADMILAEKQLTSAAERMASLEADVGGSSRNVSQLRQKLADLSEERDDLVRQLLRSDNTAQQLARDNKAYDERTQLLEDKSSRLEKENLDHLDNIRRCSATNVQLRQELDRKNATLEQIRAAHDEGLESARKQLGKLQEDMVRYKEQRDAALVALDALQEEAKQSNFRANRLSSNFDSVEREVEDVYAQRNAAIKQANQARAESERMRESLVRQQQEIAALQAFIDENSVRKKEGQDVNGFLEDMVHQSKLDALAAEERERRRTKELMGVVATVWDYRGKEKQGRSVSRDRNSRDRKSRGREPSSKVEARTDDTSSKVLAGHHQPLPLPGRDGNPRESQIGGSVLLSTFNGIFGTTTAG